MGCGNDWIRRKQKCSVHRQALAALPRGRHIWAALSGCSRSCSSALLAFCGYSCITAHGYADVDLHTKARSSLQFVQSLAGSLTKPRVPRI